MAQLVKNPPAMWETWVQSLGQEDPLEKGKAAHSSTVAWKFHGLYSSAVKLCLFEPCIHFFISQNFLAYVYGNLGNGNEDGQISPLARPQWWKQIKRIISVQGGGCCVKVMSVH